MIDHINPLALPDKLRVLLRDHALCPQLDLRLAQYALALPCAPIITNDDIYLERFLVAELPNKGHVFLHRILRADTDIELHDHPWSFKVHILFGGYVEQRWENGARVERCRYPMQSYQCDDATYHRIAALLAPECWSLVITEPKTKSWFFWMPETDVRTPWEKFVEQRQRHIKK